MKQFIINQKNEETKRKEEAEREGIRKEEEKRTKQAEKAENRKREKNKKILEGFWDFRYQNLMTQFIQADNNEDVIEIGLKIFALIGVYREASIHAAKVVINDIQLPVERRKIQQIENSTYLYQNLVLHIS